VEFVVEDIYLPCHSQRRENDKGNPIRKSPDFHSGKSLIAQVLSFFKTRVFSTLCSIFVSETSYMNVDKMTVEFRSRQWKMACCLISYE